MPLERKRRVGRTPGTDSGGRPLPTPSTVLPRQDVVPVPPAGLGEAGTAAWNRLWTAGRDWLSLTTDVALLTRLCLGYDEEQVLRRELAEDGMTVPGQRGGKVAHPAVSMLRTLTAELTRYESLCGFTPSDRSRLGYAEVKTVSALAELMARRDRQASTGP